MRWNQTALRETALPARDHIHCGGAKRVGRFALVRLSVLVRAPRGLPGPGFCLPWAAGGQVGWPSRWGHLGSPPREWCLRARRGSLQRAVGVAIHSSGAICADGSTCIRENLLFGRVPSAGGLFRRAGDDNAIFPHRPALNKMNISRVTRASLPLRSHHPFTQNRKSALDSDQGER